jgi:hypothetical protein
MHRPAGLAPICLLPAASQIHKSRRSQLRVLSSYGIDPAHASHLFDMSSYFAQHASLALERVVYPCSSVNCGDMIYQRCEIFWHRRSVIMCI